MRNIEIIQKLNTMHTACESELLQLITTYDEKDFEYLRKCARDTADRIFGNKIYIRGLIEFSSICKNDCFYCGLRRSNGNAVRYRLSKDEILSCCQNGHELGFRTFVLQGGEDGFFTDDVMCDIVSEIKKRFPDKILVSRLCRNAVSRRAKRRKLPRYKKRRCGQISSPSRNSRQKTLFHVASARNVT